MNDPVLIAMEQLEDETGWPPTQRDIARRTGLARSTVHAHLERLEAEGHIRRSPDGRRIAVVVTKLGQRKRSEAFCECCGRSLADHRRHARFCNSACRAEAWRQKQAA